MTKILNHINTYADLTAYDNDKDKNYPNIAYIQETNEVKWLKEKLDFVEEGIVVCKYNVTSTSEATNLLYSSTGITNQIIDDVKQDTVQTTYTFDTLGEHTVKYKLDGTSIANYVFSDCRGLTSVTIPNSVTSIGNSAFFYCTGLTSVTIPDSVTSIGNGAFGGTAWYNNQPDGLVYAGKVAYKYKGTMPSGTNIVLKEETKGIADSAFENCSGLTNITIPNSVTSIENNAFNSCSGLESVTIGNSVTSIGNSAFGGCSGLTSITIPNSVIKIGNSAFENCTGLTSVTIPNSVTSIGNFAFGGTAWYNNQPDGLVYAGKVAYKYKGTMPSGTNIVLKEETKGIADSAFNSCTGLTSVTIPNSVTSIGNYAFKNCSSLTSVTIPNSVTSIGNGVFNNCRRLTSVTIQATTPPTLSGTSAFSKTNDCPIYVPAESLDAYQTAANWSILADRIQAIVA